MVFEKACDVFEGFGGNHHRFNTALRILAVLDQNEHMAKVVFKQSACSPNEQFVFENSTRRLQQIHYVGKGVLLSRLIVRGDNQDERAASIRMRMRRGRADGGRA
jgi:hypothetical protein